MKTYHLPFGIEVHVHSTIDGPNGSIVSDLRVLEMDEEDVAYNLAIDAIESLILAHACEGIDVGSESYTKGITATIEALNR